MNSPTGDAGAEMFGPYEIFEQLGVGGMARVHRAKKRGIEGFQRVVALKRLLSHLAEDDSFVKSFVREARLASYLQHANIIQIYDLGLVDRVYFIAMEFVRGRDLRKILKQTAYATGPMPVPMMLALTRQLCDALDYAHTRSDENGEPLGIVHRDISPSNLLVAADGHLKVIDFGIAKATTASLRTHSGRVKGKFAYMAPEAIRGKPLDHRSDLFAVGIVAHEMLTARPLFAAKNEYDTLRKITQLPIEPPSRHNPDCPPDLDDIVLTALARSPEERWQSAGAMLRALDTVAKKLALQATNRDVAEWLEWAFEQPLQSERVSHRALDPRAQAKKPALMSSAGPLDMQGLDAASIEIVWGSQAHSVDDEQPTHPGAVPRSPQGTPQSHESGAVPSRPSASTHSTLYGLAPPPAAPPRTSTVDVRAGTTQAPHVPASHVPPSHAQASHVPPSHVPPSHVPPSHVPPSHVPASHVPPSHVPASHAQATHVPPSHAPASHVPPSHVPPSHAPEPRRNRAQTPILGVPVAPARPESAHDTILDERPPFAEPGGLTAFTPGVETATIDAGVRRARAASRAADRAGDRNAVKPAARPGKKRSGTRTALWIILFIVLFASAAAGGYYFMPGTLLGKDEDRDRDRGTAPGPAAGDPAPAAAPAQPDTR